MQEDKKTEEYIALDELGSEKGDWKEKISGFLNGKYFIPVVIILTAITAFSLGRISGLQDKRPPVRIISENPDVHNPLSPPYLKGEIEKETSFISENNPQNSAAAVSASQSGSVVASKNGTKYHYPWCSGAKQISEKNKITFDSVESARAAGYTPASNCKGLK